MHDLCSCTVGPQGGAGVLLIEDRTQTEQIIDSKRTGLSNKPQFEVRVRTCGRKASGKERKRGCEAAGADERGFQLFRTRTRTRAAGVVDSGCTCIHHRGKHKVPRWEPPNYSSCSDLAENWATLPRKPFKR